MRQPRKLKRSEKEFLASKGLVAENWRVKEEDSKSIVFIHKSGKKTRKFEKQL